MICTRHISGALSRCIALGSYIPKKHGRRQRACEAMGWIYLKRTEQHHCCHLSPLGTLVHEADEETREGVQRQGRKVRWQKSEYVPVVRRLPGVVVALHRTIRIVARRLPCSERLFRTGVGMRVVPVPVPSSQQAGARFDGGILISLEASVPRVVCVVAPCPTRIHTALAELLPNVTRRRQRGRDVLPGPRDGHGSWRTRIGGTVVVR